MVRRRDQIVGCEGPDGGHIHCPGTGRGGCKRNERGRVQKGDGQERMEWWGVGSLGVGIGWLFENTEQGRRPYRPFEGLAIHL